jgi:hypothetical protein
LGLGPLDHARGRAGGAGARRVGRGATAVGEELGRAWGERRDVAEGRAGPVEGEIGEGGDQGRGFGDESYSMQRTAAEG